MSHAVLLANHGPVVAGRDLETAVNAVEELEETAKLFLLRGETTRFLDVSDVAELRARFPELTPRASRRVRAGAPIVPTTRRGRSTRLASASRPRPRRFACAIHFMAL